jgi:two-component system chemotaxis response regulator CheB
MREMADCGAATYAQDEASSVVFGMPKEAIHMGGVGDVLPLDHISAVIEQYASREPQ